MLRPGGAGAFAHPAAGDERASFAENVIFPALNQGALPESFPRQLQVDLTRFCAKWAAHRMKGGAPKDCRGCACPEKNPSSIPFPALSELLARFESGGGRSLYLTGGGEPGDYRELVPLLERLASSKFVLGLNTNGAFIERLERCDPSLVRVWLGQRSEPAIFNISVHDPAAYDSIRRLVAMRTRLDLDLVIRSTFMVHGDTRPTELAEFVASSRNAGAEIAAFRPYYVAHEGRRTFILNQAALDGVRRLVEEEHDDGIIIQAPRIDRIGEGFEQRRAAATGVPYSERPLCLSPLVALYLNADLATGMCCDTKETGVGNVAPILISKGIPATPRAYYLNALHGIVTLHGGSCIFGCGFMEYNADYERANGGSHFYAALKRLRSRYWSGRIADEELRTTLASRFCGGRAE